MKSCKDTCRNFEPMGCCSTKHKSKKQPSCDDEVEDEIISFYEIAYADVPGTTDKLAESAEVIKQSTTDNLKVTYLSGVKVRFSNNITQQGEVPQQIVLLVTDDTKGNEYTIAGFEPAHNQIWPLDEFLSNDDDDGKAGDDDNGKENDENGDFPPNKNYVVIRNACYLITKDELRTLALIPILAKKEWQPSLSNSARNKNDLVSNHLDSVIPIHIYIILLLLSFI